MKRLFCLLSVVTIITSCNHAYYSPNTANAPLLTTKGEVTGKALYSEGGNTEFTGGEAQVAVAVTDHVGVMINGMWAGKSENTAYNGTRIERGEGSYIEFGAGLFKGLDQKKKFIGELYGGAGFGTANNDYGNSQSSKVNISKLFLQPALAFKSKYFEIAFVPKLSYVNWKVVKDDLPANDPNYPSSPNYDKQQLNLIRGKSQFLCFEPALLLRTGFEGVKLQLGLSLSNPGNNDVANIMETGVASLGISFDVLPAKGKK